jgi:hypothetical protein
MQLISYSNSTTENDVSTQSDIFFIYFNLLRKCSPSEQIDELKKLNKFVSNWSIIKLYCCKHQWIKRVLEEVIPSYLQEENRDEMDSIIGKSYVFSCLLFLVEMTVLIEILGSFSVHESELKSLFLLMQDTADQMVRLRFSFLQIQFRTWSVLLESLGKMCNTTEGPSIYFNFPGIQDCVTLTPFSPYFEGFDFTNYSKMACKWFHFLHLDESRVLSSSSR